MSRLQEHNAKVNAAFPRLLTATGDTRPRPSYLWPGTKCGQEDNSEEELTASKSADPSPCNRTMTVIMSASMRESGN